MARPATISPTDLQWSYPDHQPWGIREPALDRPALVAVAHPAAERRAWLAGILARDGHRVVAVGNGQELVAQLGAWLIQGRQADLVVLAHRLPMWRGAEIARGLRGTKWEAPSMLLLDPDQARLRNTELGADAVFVWPCEADDVRTAALYLIRQQRRRWRMS